MGCCISRDSSTPSSNNPYVRNPLHNPPESSRNITAHSPHRPSSISSSHHAPHSHPVPPKPTLPNAPLKPLDTKRRSKLPDPFSIPTSTSSQNPGTTPWTQRKLDKERNDWWETRETGRREIWALYRSLVELVRAGDVAEAQGMLDASGCTCPSGKVWYAIFDERGTEYAVRGGRGGSDYEWVVFEPRGLVEEDGVVNERVLGEAKGRSGLDGAEQEEEEEDGSLDIEKEKLEAQAQAQAQARVRDKGKGRADELVKVRCRLSSTGKDYIVDMRKGEKVGEIMAKLSLVTGLEPHRHRVSLLGRLFQPHESLPTEGPRAWKEGNTLTILVMNET